MIDQFHIAIPNKDRKMSKAVVFAAKGKFKETAEKTLKVSGNKRAILAALKEAEIYHEIIDEDIDVEEIRRVITKIGKRPVIRLIKSGKNMAAFHKSWDTPGDSYFWTLLNGEGINSLEDLKQHFDYQEDDSPNPDLSNDAEVARQLLQKAGDDMAYSFDLEDSQIDAFNHSVNTPGDEEFWRMLTDLGTTLTDLEEMFDYVEEDGSEGNEGDEEQEDPFWR